MEDKRVRKLLDKTGVGRLPAYITIDIIRCMKCNTDNKVSLSFCLKCGAVLYSWNRRVISDRQLKHFRCKYTRMKRLNL